MQNLFDVVTPNLFSILASPNRTIYFRALMVLQDCYQRELNFHRSDLVSYLISQMERDLYDLTDEEISDESEDALGEGFDSLSGRAHALIRKFTDTGWLKSLTDGTTLDEVLIVPQYASILLDAFHSIIEPVSQRYNAFVYNVYSNLRTASVERDEFMFQGLQSAYDNTVLLRKSLRALLDNIHSFYQNLHLQKEVRELLAEHFESYQLSVAIAAYHPLKTFDSVYRFRPRILELLRKWLGTPSVLEQMAMSVRKEHPDLDGAEARSKIVQQILFISDTFESLDDLLKEIDRRNANYNRATVERLQYLLNSDRDIKGKLVQLMRAMPKVREEAVSPLLEAMRVLPIFQVHYLDPEMLYTEPKHRVHGKPEPVKPQKVEADAAFRREARELMKRMDDLFSQKRIAEFIIRQMKDGGTLVSSQIQLDEFDDFLRTIVAVIKSDEEEMPYEIAWDEEKKAIKVGDFAIPFMTFVRKGVNK